MIGFFVFLAAVLLMLFTARSGMKNGALSALARMLTDALSLLIALRYAYFLAHGASMYRDVRLAWGAAAAFWLIFMVADLLLTRLRDAYVEVYESVNASLLDQGLGAIFGLVRGGVYATALMMTLTLAAPGFWSDYRPAELPVRLDAAPVWIYRQAEAGLAGVSKSDPAHTRLPDLENADSADPAKFWR